MKNIFIIAMLFFAQPSFSTEYLDIPSANMIEKITPEFIKVYPFYAEIPKDYVIPTTLSLAYIKVGNELVENDCMIDSVKIGGVEE